MFTFGIFTTHTPYIVLVAFYAYFLIFGVNKAGEGKVQIAEKSSTVQFHLNNSVDAVASDAYCFNNSFGEIAEAYIFEKASINQKWKLYGHAKIVPQDYLENALFGRPPPALA